MPAVTEGALRVAFVTLGCKVNQTESESIAAELMTAPGGCAPEDAEVVVVNTCTVTGEADHKARKAVRHAHALPQRPIVVVTGCLAALEADALRALGDRVVVEADKDAVAARVRERIGAAVPPAPGPLDDLARSAAHDVPAPDPEITIRPARTRAQLKVEDGCDAFCTYCIVPYARGVPRAVPADRVVAEAERLAVAGTAEIVLTGINIGRYDDDGLRLPDLIERVASVGVPRIRLSSIEPGDVDDVLLAAAARTPAFCAHLHVPLQSGSDGVLARMGRPYDTACYAAAIARAREALPGLAVTTDIIVGFPGETDAEFAETLAFAEETGFSRLHVFRYSARPGTPAAAMDAQVPPTIRATRSAELRASGDRLAHAFASTQQGRTVEVLVERIGDGIAEGITREYVRARVPATGVRPGELVRAVVERVEPGPVLLGKRCDG